MKLDAHGYSPALLRKIVEACGQLKSAAQAAWALRFLGEIDISARHVSRLTQEIGAELAQRRDEQAARQRRRALPPASAAVPGVVAVEVDGGRLGTRLAGCGPGVHQPQHKEDKIACLVELDSQAHEQDPQPEPPPSFLEVPRVKRLVHRLKGSCPAVPAPPPGEPQPDEGPDAEGGDSSAGQGCEASPRRGMRTCVASLCGSRAFGLLMAAEAQSRNFYAACRAAFLGDGQAYNWWIQRAYFPHFTAVADFIHVLCYLYLGAWAVRPDDGSRWALYVLWLRSCWQGRVGEVIEQLRAEQSRLARAGPGEAAGANEPEQVAAEVLRYLQNNRQRMDYPAYRRAGLPVTSSLAESLVGQFNDRVKSPQKYWDRPRDPQDTSHQGAEAILQVRAALLCEDDRLAKHFANRPGNPYRRKAKPN